MCLRFEDHCRTYHSFAIWKWWVQVHGKWTDNVLVFYGYDVNCKCSISCRRLSWQVMHLYRNYTQYLMREMHLCIVNFNLMMSLLAMSLGLKFYTSRKGRTVGGGWVSSFNTGSRYRGYLWASCRKPLVGTGWARPCRVSILATLFSWSIGVTIGQEPWLLKAC